MTKQDVNIRVLESWVNYPHPTRSSNFVMYISKEEALVLTEMKFEKPMIFRGPLGIELWVRYYD